MTAPLRKIVHTCRNSQRTRRGIIQLSTLECCHSDWTNAGDRRRGTAYCFDCFYGKPPCPNARITLDLLAERDAMKKEG